MAKAKRAYRNARGVWVVDGHCPICGGALMPVPDRWETACLDCWVNSRGASLVYVTPISLGTLKNYKQV